MEFQNTKVPLYITNTIAKIDQLVRIYQMCKKTDTTKKVIVQKKLNVLINSIKQHQIYQKIEIFLSKCMQGGLDDPKMATKVERQSSNVSSIKSSNNISIQKQKGIISDASVSNNMISSQEGSKHKVKNMDSVKSSEINIKKQVSIQKKFETPSMQSSASQISNDKSEENGFEPLIENVRLMCSKYEDKIEEIIAFNEDIFTNIKQTEDKNMVYLFGINNCEKNYKKKLYICTLMKFSIFQVENCQLDGQNKYQKQYKMFQNNLRSPLGLIMCGKSIQNVKIQHLKFLVNMNSPLLVIILMQNFQEKNGIMYQFRLQTVKVIKDLNKVEYDIKNLQIRNQYKTKGVDLAKIQVVKQKVVITKNLTRSITSSFQSVQNAIQIESSNQCIKEQPNKFPYKLHTKFYVSPKSDYQLFFLDNQIIAIKMSYKEKEFDLFRKFVIEQAHNKGNFLLSTSVLKQTSQIKKQFFKLLCQCKTRDQYFLINLSGITNKKTMILSLKQNVTQEDINNSEAILFKDLQKSTEIINVVAAVTKQNYKQFETQNKVQVIDLTTKKK